MSGYIVPAHVLAEGHVQPATSTLSEPDTSTLSEAVSEAEYHELSD